MPKRIIACIGLCKKNFRRSGFLRLQRHFYMFKAQGVKPVSWIYEVTFNPCRTHLKIWGSSVTWQVRDCPALTFRTFGFHFVHVFFKKTQNPLHLRVPCPAALWPRCVPQEINKVAPCFHIDNISGACKNKIEATGRFLIRYKSKLENRGGGPRKP